MLKKFKIADIDVLMNIWKKEYASTRKKVDREQLTQRYKEVRDLFLDKNSDTILYTEDDIIEGFITIKDNKIALIYVNKKIRREGIGSMLIQSCKKKYDNLYADFEIENSCFINFLERNGFEKIENDKGEICSYKWKNSKEQKINLVYFDNDLNEKIIDANSKINIKRISIKEILKEDKELKKVKNYMKVRKSIEEAFSKRVLLYLNYGNYNETLNDIIKEIAKIEKAHLELVISEPLIIENSKVEVYRRKIEQGFKDYKIHIIDTMLKLRRDINVNKVLDEKMAVIIREIEKIAENM